MIELLNFKIILVGAALLTLVLFENIFPKEVIKLKIKIKRTLKNVFLWLLNIEPPTLRHSPPQTRTKHINCPSYFHACQAKGKKASISNLKIGLRSKCMKTNKDESVARKSCEKMSNNEYDNFLPSQSR